MGPKLVLKPVGGNFSLKDHIYEVLRDAITSMNIYDPNADLRLDERRVSEQLGISRTPLREALVRLQQEGFVDVVPRKGVYIKRKSLKEILEVITVWAALESMAARLATKRASDTEIASLRQMVFGFTNDKVHAQMDEYSEANIRFHQRILELSHCAMLKEMADGLLVHMRAIRSRAMTEGDRLSRSIVDHTHIIEVIEARDGGLAGELVRDHTMRLHDHIRKTWETLRENRGAAQS